MEKSKELEKLGNEEENDLKALGLYTKALREKRVERVQPYIDKLLEKGHIIKYLHSKFCYEIMTNDPNLRTIEFYPKANKLFFKGSKKKEWKTQGLKWIINNLLK